MYKWTEKMQMKIFSTFCSVTINQAVMVFYNVFTSTEKTETD